MALPPPLLWCFCPHSNTLRSFRSKRGVLSFWVSDVFLVCAIGSWFSNKSTLQPPKLDFVLVLFLSGCRCFLPRTKADCEKKNTPDLTTRSLVGFPHTRVLCVCLLCPLYHQKRHSIIPQWLSTPLVFFCLGRHTKREELTLSQCRRRHFHSDRNRSVFVRGHLWTDQQPT